MNQIGDICYVYEYKNRNKIKNFSDLIKIKVSEIAPDSNIVGGYEINNPDIKTIGIVKYKQDGNLIIDGKNNFYISYEKNKKDYNLKLKKYENIQLYSLYFCFNMKELKIKFKFPDILFDSEDDLRNFLELLNYSHFEIDNERITFRCNNKEYFIYDYYVYYNDKLIINDYKNIVFKYICKVKNAINKTDYDFNKKFSLKLDTFEMIKENT